MATNRKFNQHRDFKDVCEEQDYDPSVELILRRNELVEDAETYAELAEEEVAKGDEMDASMLSDYLNEVEKIRLHVERIDFKMMPYLYARKASHTISDQDGNSLLDAFAKVAKNNIPKPEDVSVTTRH